MKIKMSSLLTQALAEIENLQNKIANRELEGWEGSKRRCVLKSNLKQAIDDSTNTKTKHI